MRSKQIHQKFNIWHSYSQNLKTSWKREKPEKDMQNKKKRKGKLSLKQFEENQETFTKMAQSNKT